MKPGDVAAETWKRLDEDRLVLVKKVKKGKITVRSVRLVPFGKTREIPYNPLTKLLLVVARLGKKKAGR